MAMTMKRRIGSLLLANMLGAGILVGAAATPAQAALPSNCTMDADGNGWKCVTVTSNLRDSTFQVAYTDLLVNTTNRAATFECEAEESKTWRYSVTTGIEASAGVIFAKVDAKVDVNLEHSRASGKKSRSGIKVPARSTTACDRGVYTHVFKGTVKHVRCGSSACRTSTSKFTLKAPSTAAWRLRDL